MYFILSFKILLSGSLSNFRTRIHYFSMYQFHICNMDWKVSPNQELWNFFSRTWLYISPSIQSTTSSYLWTFPKVYCCALLCLNFLLIPYLTQVTDKFVCLLSRQTSSKSWLCKMFLLLICHYSFLPSFPPCLPLFFLFLKAVQI